MENNIQKFGSDIFGTLTVVTFDGNDEPWFIANEVAAMLGYENKYKAMQDNVDAEDRKCLNFKANNCELLANDFNNLRSILWSNPNDFNDKWLINESGLYSLILGSKLESAKQFKRWVTKEVLPSIRKHGIYAVEEVKHRMLTDPDYIIQVINQWKVELAKRKAVELERDVAIQTKAYISDKKTATAMATASAATRKVASLENQLGKGKCWKEVKAIPWLKDIFALSKHAYIAIGKQLSLLSRQLGYKIQPIESSEYGTVNAYHVDVIEALHDKLLCNNEYMASYRSIC